MKVSLCYNSWFNFWTTKSIIDNLLKNAQSSELELLIRDKTKDERITEYFSGLSKQHENVLAVLVDDEDDDCEFERLFKEATGEYILIYPTDEVVFIENDYITELIYHICNIEKSGVLSIKSSTNGLNLVPLLMNLNDGFKHVWKNTKNTINKNDLKFFRKELLEKVNDISMISQELSSSGYHNYYLPNKNCFNV